MSCSQHWFGFYSKLLLDKTHELLLVQSESPVLLSQIGALTDRLEPWSPLSISSLPGGSSSFWCIKKSTDFGVFLAAVYIILAEHC